MKIIIYKIFNSINDKIYIGSTSRTLKERFNSHVYSIGKQKYPLLDAFDELGINNFQIIELESFDVENSEQQYQIESEFIKKYDSIKNGYNLYLPRRTRADYYQSNKEFFKEKAKNYRLKNIDKITEEQKQTILCETCNKIIGKHHKSRHSKTKSHLENLGL